MCCLLFDSNRRVFGGADCPDKVFIGRRCIPAEISASDSCNHVFCSIAVQESSADRRPVDSSDLAVTCWLMGEAILYADTSIDSE